MIIVIAISTSPNELLAQYILTSIRIVMASVHIMIKPYDHKYLNVFDGLVLQIIVLVVVLPVFESSNSDLVMTFTFVLIMFPLVTFVVFIILNCKGNIKKSLQCYFCKNSVNVSSNPEISASAGSAVKSEATSKPKAIK